MGTRRGVGGTERGQISNIFSGRGASAPQSKIVDATAMTGCCSAQMRRIYSMLLAEILISEEYKSSSARSSYCVPCETCLAKAAEIRSHLQQQNAESSGVFRV